MLRNVNLRAEPNTASEVLKTLKPGNDAKLLDRELSGGYFRVLHRVGVGFVWSRNVQILPEYDRGQWKHWTDEDGDCQKTRDEVLIAESTIAVTFKTDRQCRVASGRWEDPYTGETFTNPKDLDVDHMVPLQNAHRSGGWEWTYGRRGAYANDMDRPEHLIAVKAGANRAKGAKGPDKWKPSNIAYHCQYARDWEAIKQSWELEISSAERVAVDEMKADCP